MSLYTPGLFNLEAENDEALESTLEVEIHHDMQQFNFLGPSAILTIHI